MPDLSSTPMISSLERYLSLTTQNQKRISSNMANIDTPGYHTREIDFQAEMRKSINAGFEGRDGSGFEDTAFATGSAPVAHEVRGLLERPDGNNVSLDREGLMLSQSQLQFQLGEQLVKHEFHQLLSAINGGS